MKLSRTLTKLAVSAAAISILFSCVPGRRAASKFEVPGTGRYYRTEIDGKQYFVWFEHADANSADGHFYSESSDSTVARHMFSVTVNPRLIDIVKDSISTLIKLKGRKNQYSNIEWTEYTEPEYRPVETRTFREPYCEVEETSDLTFGQAKGYWTSLPGVEAEVSKAFTNGYVKSFKYRDLDLQMDLYRPVGVTGKRPLILFIHGGAFYVGDKKEPAYIDFCRHFAGMGYVTASINYRMGFHLGKGEIERAGYVALQDAHAALRFLVSKADEYGIDTDQLYVAGSSAGSITALNLAFMTERDRPESSYGGKGLFNAFDQGPIAGSGNDIKADFKIKAVANMWGAVSDLSILKNSRTDIISFHGDADNIVPFAEGYPFSTVGDVIAKGLSGKMYGSQCIDSVARERGLKSAFFPFKGLGHAFNTTGKDKKPNGNHTVIKDEITSFFFREMIPEDAYILSEGDGYYFVDGDVKDVTFLAEGAFVLGIEENSDDVNMNEIHLLWKEDAQDRILKASGYYSNGIGFETGLRP